MDVVVGVDVVVVVASPKVFCALFSAGFVVEVGEVVRDWTAVVCGVTVVDDDCGG